MPYIELNSSFSLQAGGATESISVNDANRQYLITGTQTITGDNVFQASGTPVEGLTYVYLYQAVATYSGGKVTFHGTDMSADQAKKNHIVKAVYTSGAWNVDFIPDLAEDRVIEIDKLAGLTAAYIILGDASGNPVATAVSGDISINSSGVVSITPASIVNADVNGSAEIELSKLEDLTSAQMIVGSAADVPTAVAISGDITISNSGVVSIANGVIEAANLHADLKPQTITVYLDFSDASKVGDYKIRMPKCEVTHIYATPVGSFTTDDATITPKDNAGSTMQNGATSAALTIAAGSTIGSGADNSDVDTNNSFTKGQFMTLTTAKTTKDGQALVSIEITRT